MSVPIVWIKLIYPKTSFVDNCKGKVKLKHFVLRVLSSLFDQR